MANTFICLFISCYLQLQYVPVLCYHNISKSDNEKQDLLHISEKQLYAQFQYLHDQGYETITPDELYANINSGSPLPSKPIMLTFDDSHASHYEIAVPALNKYHFRGVFFIMTVCLDKPGWLKTSDIKEMSAQGHIIGCHTWDHPDMVKHPDYNVNEQLIKPKKYLEKITGTSISYFAYPFGMWGEQTVKDLKDADFIGAYQLDKRQYATDKNFTIRRIMVGGAWTGAQLEAAIEKAYNKNTAQ